MYEHQQGTANKILCGYFYVATANLYQLQIEGYRSPKWMHTTQCSSTKPYLNETIGTANWIQKKLLLLSSDGNKMQNCQASSVVAHCSHTI